VRVDEPGSYRRVNGPALRKLALLALLGAEGPEWTRGAFLGKGPAPFRSAAVVLALLSSTSRSSRGPTAAAECEPQLGCSAM